ncbi:unnamed protein product [Xylocopa violacea]|uniref:Reverse transcriptase domain-containing protein n=1 Tax=Xylocopa violacea TaxID=135666 RepID=A0ABP1MYE7_XYLVO
MVDNTTQRTTRTLVYDEHGDTLMVYDSDNVKVTCPSCKIDLSSRSSASAAQHKRRCNAPPVQTNGHVCEVCKKEYKTYAGLRLHQRKAHIEFYNSADLELRDKRLPSTRAQYTDSEIKNIAFNEARIPNRSNMLGKDIVKILADSSNRPVEGIKRLRLRDKYKEYLSEEIKNATEENTRKICPLTPRINLSHLHKPSVRVSTPNQPATIWNNKETPSNSDTTNLISSGEICSLLRTLKDETTDKMSRIIDAILSNEPEMNIINMLDEYIKNIPNFCILANSMSRSNSDNSNEDKNHNDKDQRKNCNKNNNNRYSNKNKKNNSKYNNNKNTINNNNNTNNKYQQRTNNNNNNRRTYKKRIGQRAKKKASEYMRMQKLYKKNPSQVAEHILSGNELNVLETPTMQNFEKFYTNLFAHKNLELKERKYKHNSSIDLSYAVTYTEVHEQLAKLKESAPGTDEIGRRALRRMPRPDLHALLNIIWGSKILPPILRLNRTVLLPKTGDLKDPKQWRPITISSRVLRLLNKIVVTRLENKIRLFHVQRGFTRIDGIMANNTILQTLIKTSRSKSKPFVILSIDLAKAFDSVNIVSIVNALIEKGVDAHTIKYIKNTYKDVTTILECHGQRSVPISIKRGVKQGDPMSGFLFNLVIDELLKKLDQREGVDVNGTKITALAFADDIVLVARNPKVMCGHIKVLEDFFRIHGFEVNVSKCAAFQNLSVPGTKRLVVDTRSHLCINGTRVPTLGVASQLKYLGHNYAFYGTVIPSPSKLEDMLCRLKKSPLKPWQKLNILQRYLIPRLHHGLQTMDINKKKLKYIDTCIEKFTKTILHLPITTPTPYIHAPLRNGGLGIPSLAIHIAAIYLRRLERLKIRGDEQTRNVLASPIVEQLIKRLKRMVGNVNVATKTSTQQYWSDQLHNGALGAGLSSMSPGVSEWIYDPPEYWKGRDYIGAIKLRIGLLPTKGAPYMSNTDCRNASCTGTRETVYHILQRCPITHYNRINRHDNINKILKASLEKANIQAEEAPKFSTKNDRYIPDIIAIKNSTAYVIETTVAYESKPISMSNAYRIKKQKYDTPDLVRKIKDTYNVSKVKVMPFVVGARGCWLETNDEVIKEFKLSHKLKNIISTTSLQWGVSIHRTFMNSVWRKPNNFIRRRN